MERPQNIAVIGASAAGVSAAIALRSNGFEGRVAIYDEDCNLPYERPPLSKSLSKLDDEIKLIEPLCTYVDLDIELRLGVGVKALNAEDMTLTLTDGEHYRHDRVILATGVSAKRIHAPGSSLEHILYLRNADDAKKVSARLLTGAGPLVIVGGGFIGLELAAVARSLAIDVTVVEIAPLPLLAPLGPEVAALIHQMHLDRGVRFITGRQVAAFRGNHVVEDVVLDDGVVLQCRTAVVGVGVVPNDLLARGLGVTTDLGVATDNSGATANPWLWSAGDVAVRKHPMLRRTSRIEHWDTAQRHGQAVGRSLSGQSAEDTAVPYVWSDQYEFTFQSFGRREPSDSVVLREGALPHEFLAFFVEKGHVQAVAGIGHPREVRAGRTLIENGPAVSAQALRDPETDIRRLGRSVAQVTS